MNEALEDYKRGYSAAMEEIATGHIYDLPEAIKGYQSDPADSDFLEGHFDAIVFADAMQRKWANR
ncbi:hypothetical protein [Curvivirga aplysinae]|uniref:hypothetical protein n=1 Tax=Curvivirga aplysinae TaxID=2529852 RepID=UPI001C3F5DA2|nr:hypothetical protein [Curvivirga aplysinae]